MRKQVLFYWLIMVVLTAAVLSGCNDDQATTKKAPPASTSSQQTTDKTPSVGNQTSTTGSQSTASSDVRVYTANGNYTSPAGLEDYNVTITTNKDGVVTDVNAVSSSTNERSIEFQQLFLDGIKGQVIGKPLKDLGAVDNVNGSSLTPVGYNKALEQIKAQAKVS